MHSRLRVITVATVSCAFVFVLNPRVQAATVNWTVWNAPASVSNTANETVTGATADVGVTYVGNIANAGFIPGFVWTPTSTFSGGTVSNSPPSPYTEITEQGGNTNVDTITFSQAVLNPVIAVASLGSGGLTAQLDFTASEPFTIEAGGPSTNFGGSTIALCPSSTTDVCGAEGSGVIQFMGTYTSLTWTNPTLEYYDLITVGDEGLAPVGTTPLPAALPLFATGLGAMGLLGWRRKRKNAIAATI